MRAGQLSVWTWPRVAGFAAALLLAGLADTAQAQIRDLAELRACITQNLPQSSFRQRIRLVSYDPAGGSRELDAVLYGTRQSAERISLMLDVRAPGDLAGSRYLLIERAGSDDMYVYLPALGRTRRVIGGMRGQPLWGTDFSYEDIKRLQSALLDGRSELSGRVVSQDRPAHRLRLRPAPDAQSAYTYLELDLDDRSCLLLEARFFDAAGLVKHMRADPARFRQLGTRWLLGRVSMHNLRAGTHSTLDLDEVEYDQRLSMAMFNPATFHYSR